MAVLPGNGRVVVGSETASVLCSRVFQQAATGLVSLNRVLQHRSKAGSAAAPADAASDCSELCMRAMADASRQKQASGEGATGVCTAGGGSLEASPRSQGM